MNNTIRITNQFVFFQCNPLVIDENIPISLAVNRFYFRVGIKSRIVVLHERMCKIDGRIHNLLHIQECLLRRVVEKMFQMMKKEKGLTIQFQIRNMMTKPEYLSLFNNLVNASLGLKKNLDTFRICCDRLLIIEEERNSIGQCWKNASIFWIFLITQVLSDFYLKIIKIEKNLLIILLKNNKRLFVVTCSQRKTNILRCKNTKYCSFGHILMSFQLVMCLLRGISWRTALMTPLI